MRRSWWNNRQMKVMAPDGAPSGMEETQQSFMDDILGLEPEASVTNEDANGDTNETDPSLDSETELNLEQDAGVVEANIDPEPAAAIEPSIEEQLRSQLVAMAAQLEALQNGNGVHQIYPTTQEPAQTAEQTQQPGAVQAQTQQPAAAQAYLTEEELDQIIDNPALILTAISRAQTDIVNQFTQNLPSVVSTIVNQQVAIQTAVTEFYTSNEDLRPHADYVRFVMREIETKHKDKTFNEIFQMTADESRKRLGLKNPAQQTATRGQSTQQRPAFAGSRRTGTQRPATGKPEMFDPAAADMLP